MAEVDSLNPMIKRLPIHSSKSQSAIAFEQYRDKVDSIYTSIKPHNKKNKDSEAHRTRRAMRQKGYGRMVKRTQKYLGLRDNVADQTNPSQHYSTYQNSDLDGPTLSQGNLVADWSVDMLVPFKVKNSVRFICVDIEAWEDSPNIITEVGLAVLDTEDIMDIPPGEGGHNWFSSMKSYHFRIKEHAHNINHKHLEGCPDNFNFGYGFSADPVQRFELTFSSNSQFVSIGEINREIGAVIGDHSSEDRRPVIMVGHDLSHDLRYLRKLGYNIWRVPQFSDEIDTQSMFKSLERERNGRGLASVCSELGIQGYHFHNAGNDAAYTLRAMVAMAVRQMNEKCGRIHHRNEER